MTLTQKCFAVIMVLLLLGMIIYLVKKGKLREEYSWIWMLTGFLLLALVFFYDVLILITGMIGAVMPTTALFIFGIIFLILVSLHFAVKISELTTQVKNLAQEVSLLRAYRDLGD
jgi:hypothetical protein